MASTINGALLFTLLLFSVGCSGSEGVAIATSTSSTKITENANTPTAPVTTTLVPAALTTLPSSSAAPQPTSTVITATATIKLITVEELYAMVKVFYNEDLGDTYETAPYATVDCRIINGWNLAHIPQAVSIEPNIYHTESGLATIESNLKMLPKGKLLVFYDDDLEMAPALANLFLELNKNEDLGYDPLNVRILKEGFVAWMDLKYPTRSAAQ
jgi:hypothetical protein